MGLSPAFGRQLEGHPGYKYRNGGTKRDGWAGGYIRTHRQGVRGWLGLLGLPGDRQTD